ncbi:RpoE-regulated lipoprotein [Salmonella enterica subsp. enterica serovar Choleraesuis]|nr:RpoE-regulated lipoprotein [Salmonella enterica subsp. enterica serovar Choleraesuis]
MKCLRMMALCLPMVLGGCSTLSSVHWSKALPWNWFGSSLEISDQGLGNITAGTHMDQDTISDALGSSYRVRSGMKTHNGGIVSFYEALRDDRLSVVVEGENSQVSKITVMDPEIETANGVKIGTQFSELYSKAFGACSRATGDDAALVACKAPGSQHLIYLFSGMWHGPDGLIPSDDALKNWKLNKIIWQR